MAFHAAHALVAAALAAGLGTPLRQDGYTLRPPEGFRMTRMDLFHGTRAGAVAVGKDVEDRSLSAALSDGDGPDAATLLVSLVDEPFSPSPSSRDAFTTAAMKHYADELQLPLSLQRAELIAGDSPRVQVLATLKQQEQLRTLVIAAMPGNPRHAVVTFSIPSARFDALWPDVRASLESFRADPQPGVALPRSFAAALLLGMGVALLASWSLWKRRRRMRRAELGLPG